VGDEFTEIVKVLIRGPILKPEDSYGGLSVSRSIEKEGERKEDKNY